MTNHKVLQRHGAILAAVMVCLLVVMLFVGVVGRALVLRQQATRLDERQVQCFWVTESAALRAIAKTRRDAAYRGEVWRMKGQIRGRELQGVAEIQVEPVPGNEDRKQITITARWPDAPVERVSRTKKFFVDLKMTGVSP